MAETPQGWSLEPAVQPQQGWTLEPAEEHGLLATGAHYAAKALPVIGGFLGAIPGAAGGAAVGLPTGPGAIASTAIGAGIGAGMGAAAGRGAQHVVDTALGYEKPIGSASDLGAKVGDMAHEGVVNGASTASGTAVMGTVLPPLAKAAGSLKDVALAQGRRFLTGGAASLSGKAPIADSAVQAAFDAGAIKPLGTLAGASKVLGQARDSVGDMYSRIVMALQQAGIKGPNAEALAQKIAAEGQSIAASSMEEAVPSLYASKAALLAEKPVDSAGNLALSQSEGMKQSLQSAAKYGKFEETPLNEARRDLASIFRQANEDAIEQGAAASANPQTQAIAAQFKPVKAQYGDIASADDAAFKGAAQAARRRAMSPTDYIAAAAGVAKGGLGGGAAMGVANNLARTRGTSTVAWAANSVADKMQSIATANPAALGRFGPILQKALSEGGQQAFDAHSYALSQSDPEFQALQKQLSEKH